MRIMNPKSKRSGLTNHITNHIINNEDNTMRRSHRFIGITVKIYIIKILLELGIEHFFNVLPNQQLSQALETIKIILDVLT